MNIRMLVGGLVMGVLLAAGGCTKKPETAEVKPGPPKPLTVAVVKSAERSRHFLAVNRELELGGTLYGYVDVDGDMLKLAGMMGGIFSKVAAAQPALAPLAKQDYGAIFTALGLTDIKAVGFSSVPDGTGYFRNRTFFYTPDQRHGLLAGLGGPPAPFKRLGIAPADTDFYSEAELDLPAVYAAVREVVAKVGGDKATESMEEKLQRKGGDAVFSAYNFIQDMKGRVAVVVRMDGGHEMRIPGPQGLSFPAVSVLICVDGVAPAIEPSLVQSPLFTVSQVGTTKRYTLKQPLPVEGIAPVFVVDGTSLYLASSPAFMDECRKAGPGGLADRADFKEALAHLGGEGNALAYVSPNFFRQIKRIPGLNPGMPAQTRQIFDLVDQAIPEAPRPLVTVRSNLPDGILVRSYWNRSLKQDVAALAVYNPVTIGMMAAMAVPAFQKVRAASQEKAVLNNLRQLSAAADQYYLEKGLAAATYDDLVGPGKYIKAINPVDGEDYHRLIFKQGLPLHIRVPSLQKVVRYAP